MTVQLIQFCPSLQLLQSFFQNIALKGTWRRDEWLSLFQFYRKTFLRSVDPKQPKSVKFSLWSTVSLKLSQGEMHDFSGEVQKFSGEMQNDLRGGTHLPLNPAMFSYHWSRDVYWWHDRSKNWWAPPPPPLPRFGWIHPWLHVQA